MNADSKTYRQELNELVAGFLEHKAEKGENPFLAEDEERGRGESLTLNPDDLTLDDKQARELHEELCRRSGMTGEELIADWNRRSPANDQW